MSIASKFTFIGNVVIPKPKDSSHSNYYSEWENEKNSNVSHRKIRFLVKDSPSNSAFVELFGSKYPSVKTMDKDNGKIEIPWEDRDTPEALNLVAPYKKFIVDLGPDFGGRHEFITEYDMIGYLADNMQNYANDGGKIYITGQVKKSFYKGKCYDNFYIKNVYAVEPDRPSKLELSMDLFYNGDSVDTTDLKSENKIYVNGYISQYIDKDNGVKYIPQTVTMSFAKYDLTNELHQKRMEYRKSYISKLTKKKMYHLMWQCRYINGAEEIDFDESMLTRQQLEQVELGIKTLDDFKPTGRTLGDSHTEIRLVDPVLTGSFSEGILECDETVKEFEENIFTMPEEESIDEVVEKAKKAEDEGEDLFKDAVVEDEFAELF